MFPDCVGVHVCKHTLSALSPPCRSTQSPDCQCEISHWLSFSVVYTTRANVYPRALTIILIAKPCVQQLIINNCIYILARLQVHYRGVGTGGATGARAPPFLPTSCHVADSTAPTQRARQRALTGDAIGDLYIH